MPKKKAEEPEPPKKPKSSTAEVALRVEEVLRIRIDGAAFHDVVLFASEKGWGISDRQVTTYIQRADALIVERNDKSRKKVLARHLAQRMALYARALNAADFRTALAVLDSDAKLRGLFPEKELKVLVKLAAAQGVRIEELERRLRDAHPSAATPPATGEPGPPARPPERDDAGRPGGAAPGVPGGPAPADA